MAHAIASLTNVGPSFVLILGMRPGEFTGLRWEDVDFDTGVISVLQFLKHSRGTLWQGDTKTRQSRRRFKAPPATLATLATLESYRAGQAAEKLKAGEAWTDTAIVFTTEVGTPIDPANLRRAFRALIKAAGTADIGASGQAERWLGAAPARGLIPHEVAVRSGAGRSPSVDRSGCRSGPPVRRILARSPR